MAAEENGSTGGSQQDNQTAIEGTVTSTGLPESPGFVRGGSASDSPVVSMASQGNGIEGELRPAPRQISEAELKQLRRMYFTVRHDRVEECGHRFDRLNEPRTNCHYCWWAWFNSHGELVQTVDKAFQEQGAAFVIKLRGRKFLKGFLMYMSTLAKFQQEAEAMKEITNGQQGEVDSVSGVGQEIGQGERQSDIS